MALITIPAIAKKAKCDTPASGEIIVGAACTSEYVPLLKGKKVALLSNHTGVVGDKHVLDIMLEKGVDVTTIFSPEHGFRGNADGGGNAGDLLAGNACLLQCQHFLAAPSEEVRVTAF